MKTLQQIQTEYLKKYLDDNSVPYPNIVSLQTLMKLYFEKRLGLI